MPSIIRSLVRPLKHQFLIIDGDKTALLDSGGDLTYAKLKLELEKLSPTYQLNYIIVSSPRDYRPNWLLDDADTGKSHMLQAVGAFLATLCLLIL